MRWTGRLSGGDVDDDFGEKTFLVAYGLFAFLTLAGLVLGGVGLFAYATGNEALAKDIGAGLFLGASIAPVFVLPGLGYLVWQDLGRIRDDDTGWTFASLTLLSGTLVVLAVVLFLLVRTGGRGSDAGVSDPTPVLGLSYGVTLGAFVLATFLAAGILALVRLLEDGDGDGEPRSRNRRAIDRYR